MPHASPAEVTGIADLPLLAASGPAAVINVTVLNGAADPGVSPAITPGHIACFEARHGLLRPREAVLLHTGWGSRYQAASEGAAYGADVLVSRCDPGWSAPHLETIDLLREPGVSCVGTDGLSVGPAENGTPTHLIGLPHGMAFVEALRGLQASRPGVPGSDSRPSCWPAEPAVPGGRWPCCPARPQATAEPRKTPRNPSRIEMSPTTTINGAEALSRFYTPGVADDCQAIVGDPTAYRVRVPAAAS